MKDTLAVGTGGSTDHVVTDDLCTAHAGPAVLATPRMIGLIETDCMHSLAPHLDDDETSVGIHVCVSHQARASLGETVSIAYRLAEIDRRRLTYEVTVTRGDTVVSHGTHQRAVVKKQ